MEELRELLRRDRILEPFGVLLDLRYVHADLQDYLRRSAELPVSVLYADMDKFKPINDKFGHDAGDVVLKSYLETVRDTLGSFGTGYRGRGDEVIAIIAGQGHERAVEIAEKIRSVVEAMKCDFQGKRLPNVTASIGVATTPPESRSMELQSAAEARNRQAKESGRNRVVSGVEKMANQKSP
jgi:diguanylate cyclase (GGDEF)-like protein